MRFADLQAAPPAEAIAPAATASPRFEAPRDPRAPTCGPCCHGHCDKELDAYRDR